MQPLRLITVFTKTLHRPISLARAIQPILCYPISLRSILILSIHLYLGLPIGIFDFDFTTKILHAFFIPIRVTWPARFILLDLIIVIKLAEVYKSYGRIMILLLYLKYASPYIYRKVLELWSHSPVSEIGLFENRECKLPKWFRYVTDDQSKTGNTLGLEINMTLYHFGNCLALVYVPYYLTYKYSGL
jgi:hypothetical protein